MEDRLTLLTEFPIDNERLKKEMGIAKKEIFGGGEAAEQTAERVNKKIVQMVSGQDKGVRHLDRSIKSLKIQMQSYQAVVEKSTDPRVIIEYNRRIDLLRERITRLTNVGKRGFDAMGVAIQKNIVWNNGLVRGLSRTVEQLRRLAYIIPGLGISGLFFLAWEPLSKFVKQLWDARKAVDELAASQKSLSDARLKGNQSAQAELTSMNRLYAAATNANLPLAERRKAVDALQKQYPGYLGNVDRETIMAGKATDAYKNLTNAIIATAHAKAYQDKISENASTQLENMQKMADLQAKFNDAQLEYERHRKRLEGSDPYGNPLGYDNLMAQASAAEAARDAIGRQINELGEANGRLERENRKFVQTIDQIVSKNGVGVLTGDYKGGPDAEKVPSDVINRRRALLDKLDALNVEYLRKSLTRDQEEIQAVRDKFAKIRLEVERFNADPKNRGLKIDIAGLAEVEDRAIADLAYRQGTERLKAELDVQRTLWQQYEEYKTATSKEHADARFENELSKINSFREDLARELATLTSRMLTVGLTGPEQERMKLLAAMSKDVTDKEQADRDARFKKAYSDYATFEQKRAKIVAGAEQAITDLRAKGENEQAENARKARDKELTELTEAYLKSQGDIKRLFEDFEKFGARGQLRLIDAAKKAFEQFKKETKLGAGELEILNGLFDEYLGKLDRAAKGDLAGGIIGLSAELQGIVGQIAQIDQGLGQALQTLGQMAQSYVKISEIVSQIGDSVQGAGESSGNVWVAAIGAVVELIGTIWTAIAEGRKRRRAAEKAAQEDLRNFQAQEISGEREYQRLLRQREIIIAQAGKSSYQSIIAQLDLLKRQAPEIESAYNKIFAALQDDEFIDGKDYKHGTWFRKAKTWDIMASLAGSDYERLEQLYLQGKLKDTAKADFEALQSLKEELEAIGLDVRDLQQQLAEMLTGTTADGLADRFMELRRNGKLAAADLGKSFEEIMGNAIRATFKQKYLVDAMQPFYEELANLMSLGTPTESEIARLRELYEKVGLEASEYWSEIEKITGQKLSDSDGSTGIPGRINRTIEEATASQILGFERARYDLGKQALGNAEETLRVDKQLYDATLQSIRHQAAIERNTADTVTELKAAVVELKAINNNTKKGQSDRDLGI